MAVETSIIVEFGDQKAESASIVVEIDDLHPNNLDIKGDVKSSFHPTEFPVFLIHHDTDIEITGVLCTHGEVIQIGVDQTRSRSLEAVFTTLLDTATEDDNKISIGYSNVVLDTEEWYGNIGNININEGDLCCNGGIIPCFVKVDFSVVFQEQWKLSPPDIELAEDETYTVYVVIYVRSIS